MRYLVPCVCAAALLPAGCGRGQPALAPVSGRVFYRGQPLAGGTIVFTPDPERGGCGPLACGEVGKDGSYSLSTGREKGAVPGWHRVTVAPARVDGPDGKPAPAALPRCFSDPDLGGQCVEVKPGRLNTHDIRLE
jgi:hypothetical protein